MTTAEMSMKDMLELEKLYSEQLRLSDEEQEYVSSLIRLGSNKHYSSVEPN
jgi:hypothetical protein